MPHADVATLLAAALTFAATSTCTRPVPPRNETPAVHLRVVEPQRLAPPPAATATAAASGTPAAAAPAQPTTREPPPHASNAPTPHGAAVAEAAHHIRQQTFDRAKLRDHRALLHFVKKIRAQLDRAAAQLEGKRDAAARIEKLQASQRPAIAAHTEALHTLDPDGTHSKLTLHHDTNLNFLADEYPAAVIGALTGDPQPLAEIRAEMDTHQHEIEASLRALSRPPP